jgi:hypothetical protein
MKRLLIFAAIAALVPLAARAQGAQASGNPVSDSVKAMVAQHAKAIIAAADEMPADKYSYKPTDGPITFGHLIMHLAQTDPKDKWVTALKASFDYCGGVLDKTDDSKLNEMVPGFRGSVPRARVMITLVADLYDHYSAEAAYLRLNGMLPPTAQPRPGQ